MQVLGSRRQKCAGEQFSGTVMHKNVKASGDAGAPEHRMAAARQSARVRSASFGTPPVTGEGLPRVEVVQHWAPANVSVPRRPVGGWSKRVFDICFAFGVLVLLAPLLAVVALAVRMDSKGPSFFRQERGGFNGRTFRIWKFRTMSVMENRGVVQARHHDARITRLGNFLRRSSWDELPQLFNVLTGDMSIIGPRPHAIEHDIQFNKVDPSYCERFGARPGITGLAQVNGCRGPTETEAKVRARTAYDAEYVRNWTWWREIEIMFATAALLFWKKDPGAF
jgi:putative colanic acid biosynthesis UDP-glucose lipid carrier transferase